MALPLVVIEELARNLRNRENTIALKGLTGYSRIAREALLKVGGFTPADLMEVRMSRIDELVPLPFGQQSFSDKGEYVEFDGHRLKPRTDIYPTAMEWIIVGEADNGDHYVMAASDPHTFEPGELIASIDIAQYDKYAPVKYTNLILNTGLAIYKVTNWKEAAIILNGLFNPEASEFNIDVDVDVTVGDNTRQGQLYSNDLTMPAPDQHVSGIGILTPKAADPRNIEEGLAMALAERLGFVLALDNETPVSEQLASAIKLMHQPAAESVFVLYEKDFEKILSTISGAVTPIKIRKAFKDYFIAKWKLN